MSARSVRPPLRSTVAAVQDTFSTTRWAAHLPDRTTVARIARRLRARHLGVIDLTGIVVASYAALALHFEGLLGADDVFRFLPAILLILSVRTFSNVWLGLYSRGWRFASIPDVGRIVGAVVFGSLVSVAIYYGVGALGGTGLPEGLPWSFWPTEFLMSVTILGGVRFAIRAAHDWSPRPAHGVVTERRITLLYGAGRTGVLMARSAERNPSAGVVPVGFLDDDVTLRGRFVSGLRVFGGISQLPRAVALTGAQALLITMPSAPGSTVRQVVDAALALGLEVRTAPSLTDLLDGSVDAYRVRRVRVEDLLRRPIVMDQADAVTEIIADQTVLITGAGGSIGSELARRVFALGPRRLILVDRAESPLYLLQRELETRRGHGNGSGELKIHLANVANRAAMDRLISTELPSIIFHAAAYKHVPMMESHPSDAMFVNVGGTLALLDAASAAGVERFVLVSTDKAVRPSSVMGASKRIAEMLVADTARRTGRPYVSVRFGNVLGSTGSVVPIFQEQLENGEPLTITDAAMTRFFMTIPEAAWLILDAAALGKSGDLFVLDMGEPVKIMDLAHDLVRLSGRDPDTQAIDIVGLRPGEKLHEELFYDEEKVERTPNPKVLRAAADPPSEAIRDDVRRMMALATGETEELLRRVLLDYARGPRPEVETTDEMASQAIEVMSANLARVPDKRVETGPPGVAV